MALILLQPNNQPFSLDYLDTSAVPLTSILGGEICTLAAATKANSATESAAANVGDNLAGGANRVAATTGALVDASAPLFLCDDGTANYGTAFGSVIGTPAGLSTSGTQLGPHTSAASGMLTLHKQHGMYGVTQDAGDTAADGMISTNAAMVPGLGLTYGNNGRLTPVGSALAGARTRVVARFLSFESENAGSLVSTPARLAGAAAKYDHAVIHFEIE